MRALMDSDKEEWRESTRESSGIGLAEEASGFSPSSVQSLVKPLTEQNAVVALRTVSQAVFQRILLSAVSLA